MRSGIAELVGHQRMTATDIAKLEPFSADIASVSSRLTLRLSIALRPWLGPLKSRLLSQSRGEDEVKLGQGSLTQAYSD